MSLGIISTQVGHGAKTIQWSDGSLTILTYLGKKWGGGIRNVLKDVKYISDMADFPVVNLQSKLIIFPNQRMAKHDLLSTAHEALSSNKTVIIRGYMEDETFAFTIEELSGHFMSSPDKSMAVHMRLALNFPLSQKAAPPPFE
ncbi:hypothetical protein HD554DRAFT_2038690 [Boletus coccyginus]|nr:hypothetical protein HD554DRAFT_2038690 [Boletus coccyginus]